MFTELCMRMGQKKGTILDITLEWDEDLSCIRLKPSRTSFPTPTSA